MIENAGYRGRERALQPVTMRCERFFKIIGGQPNVWIVAMPMTHGKGCGQRTRLPPSWIGNFRQTVGAAVEQIRRQKHIVPPVHEPAKREEIA